MDILKYTDLAFQIAGNIIAPPIVGILLGKFLDDYFNSKPAFLFILLFFGILAGLRSLFRLVRRLGEK